MRSSETDVAAVYYTWIITHSKKQRSIKRVIRRDYFSVFIREEAERDLALEPEVVGSVAQLYLQICTITNCKFCAISWVSENE